MNIIIKVSDIFNKNNKLNQNSIQFMNSKRNITMDGEFTKIIFINNCFSMDSLLIECPIKFENHLKNRQNICESDEFLSNFMDLEKLLIDYYKLYKNTNKKPVYLLTNNLLNKSVKIFTPSSIENRSRYSLHEFGNSTLSLNRKLYAIKISGIWESYDSIGITYKIIEFSDLQP